ncbi:MAG: bifunctional riboflavin kinase/FAD synthetase [Kiritimatiellia bacterium]
MKVVSTPSELRSMSKSVVLAVGFFDGVHRGHQEVILSAVKRAEENSGEAWVMTFDRHPLSFLAPYKRPRLLSTTEERLDLFCELGIDGVLLVEFNAEIADQSPEEFVRWLCGDVKGSVGIVEICCGDNWRFGRYAAGTPALLAGFGKEYGFDVAVVPYADFKGVEISSTRIRCAIREGRLEEVNNMLGRKYSVHGTVVAGRGIGNRLKMATANIIPDVDLLPPCGVYAVRVKIGASVYGGAANLGVRPTFADTSPDEIVLETHLFDFDEEIYGQNIIVSFVAFIRGEKKFDSSEKLVGQVRKDLKRAADVLKG